MLLLSLFQSIDRKTGINLQEDRQFVSCCLSVTVLEYTPQFVKDIKSLIEEVHQRRTDCCVTRRVTQNLFLRISQPRNPYRIRRRAY